MGRFLNLWQQHRNLIPETKQSAIDLAIKRVLLCPGLSMKESAAVFFRMPEILKSYIIDDIKQEYRKIMAE